MIIVESGGLNSTNFNSHEGSTITLTVRLQH